MAKTALSPSILDSNFAEIKKTIKLLDKAGVEYIHFDIMDGNFVPNLTFGPKIIKPLRPLTKTVFDVHLMIQNPEKYTPLFIDAGADIITFHYEAVKNVAKAINLIKSYGKKAGVSIKPKTPATVLKKYLKDLDLVLIMSVEPGFGGQKFMPESLQKAAILKKEIIKKGYKCLLEIDGGINMETAPLAAAAGIDILVAGSAIFGAKNPMSAIKQLRAAIAGTQKSKVKIQF
ncbi:MAG: ribulose-phosphate 3-epimerase [Spirochaetia bacterium]|nr:ribulose-phosphate 3-epimerase [Spirochaetia bacterium]